MRKFVRRAIVSLAAVAAMLVSPQAALACSCDRDALADLALTAPLIFKGDILKSDILPRNTGPIWYGPNDVKTTFQIKAVLKGRTSNTEDIYSVGYSSSCGIDFLKMVGRTLVIAAYEVDGHLFTDFCSFWHLNRLPAR